MIAGITRERHLKTSFLACGACALGMSSLALAADPTIEFQQSVYTYSRSTTGTKPSGGETKTSTDAGFTTMPSDLEISVRAERWEITVFPTQPGSNFEVLNEIWPHIRVGFNLGYNNAKHDGDDGKTSSESWQFGPQGQYEIAYGYQSIEFELNLDAARSDSKNATTGAAVNASAPGATSISGYVGEVQAYYARRVTDNLELASGLGYTYGKSHDKVANAEITSGQLEIFLFQMRAGIY